MRAGARRPRRDRPFFVHSELVAATRERAEKIVRREVSWWQGPQHFISRDDADEKKAERRLAKLVNAYNAARQFVATLEAKHEPGELEGTERDELRKLALAIEPHFEDASVRHVPAFAAPQPRFKKTRPLIAWRAAQYGITNEETVAAISLLCGEWPSTVIATAKTQRTVTDVFRGERDAIAKTAKRKLRRTRL